MVLYQFAFPFLSFGVTPKDILILRFNDFVLPLGANVMVAVKTPQNENANLF